MDDIFSKNEPFIIENVFFNDRNADIFIGGDGRIGSIGPGTAKNVRAMLPSPSTGKEHSSSPDW
jgi:hypothetical protein